MAHRNLVEMALTTGQLNEMDAAVLDLLYEGRVTPALARAQLAEQWDEDDDVPRRQYINQRLTRLSEHGHVRNLQDKGVYELVSDPRTEDDGETVAERLLTRLSRQLGQPITVGETVYEDGDTHQLAADSEEDETND